MATAETDAISGLRWGLSRYAWLLVACMFLLAVALPFLQSRQTASYEATAVVSATRVQVDSTTLPRFGETIFNSGVVERRVRSFLEDTGRAIPDDVIPDSVELTVVEDSITYEVVGKAQSADDAADLANLAAAEFTNQLNKPGKGVAVFTVLSHAQAPEDATSNLLSPLVSVVVGWVAGAVLGLGMISLLLVLRRPVYDVLTIEQTVGVPGSGRIRLPRSKHASWTDVPGLPQATRRLLASGAETFYLVSSPRLAGVRSRVAEHLAAALGQLRRVERTLGPVRKGSLRLVDDATASDLLNVGPRSLVVVVVKEGVGAKRLRAELDEYADVSSVQVLLVTYTWRRPVGSSHDDVPEEGDRLESTPMAEVLNP